MVEPSSEVLISRLDCGVCVVQFNRPRRKHAFTANMYAMVGEALRTADADPSCGAVLLRGDEDAFSAGNDLEDFLHQPPQDRTHPVFAMLDALVDVDVPLVAAVCGPAIGVGTTMLLHCDVVVAGNSAVFRVPFVDLGLCPEAGSSLLLPEIIGHRRAAEMLLLGDTMGAEEARNIGWVSRVVDDAKVMAAAMEVATSLAQKPRAALRGTKRLIRCASREAVREAMNAETAEFMQRLQSPEAKAAFAAFLDRRKPKA